MSYLVTGSAGFIGFHTSLKLLKQKKIVIGIDCINNYYSIKLKKKRLEILKKFKNFIFYKLDLSKNSDQLFKIFKKHKLKYVIHLAAQAGVRYSITNPDTYIDNNINGFFNVINASQKNKIKHFVYASTSSVYGDAKKFPLNESYHCNKPIQLYAATKKSNELIAHSYSSIYKMPTTGLRFFTVYGPWGRPDMALYKFTKNIIQNSPIDLFNNGNHVRDFSYIDDVVYYVVNLTKKIPRKKNKSLSRIFNIGNTKPEKLLKYLKIIENNLKKKAKIKKFTLQKGDVYKTHASMKETWKVIKKKNHISIDVGIKNFISWFKKFNAENF
ncbi:NAD-dependent epimerase/dehydratase family protein [Pelagibacterales bacterium SAG-MED21]|nr:NAD-dependent epimerase/dehydratase family protein [Pelagibacterales bacterium SAG-MED21]